MALAESRPPQECQTICVHCAAGSVLFLIQPVHLPLGQHRLHDDTSWNIHTARA